MTVLHPSDLKDYMDLNFADTGVTVSARDDQAIFLYGTTWSERICIFDEIYKYGQCTPMINGGDSAIWQVTYTIGWKKESSTSTSVSTPMYKKPSDLRPITDQMETEFVNNMKAVEPRFLFDKLREFLKSKVDLDKWDRNLYRDSWEEIDSDDAVTVRFKGISRPSAFENKWYHMFLEATIPKGRVRVTALNGAGDMWRYTTAQTLSYYTEYHSMVVSKASVVMHDVQVGGYYFVDYQLQSTLPYFKQWGSFSVSPEPLPSTPLRITKPDASWKAFFHRMDVESKILDIGQMLDDFDPEVDQITDEILHAIEDKYHLEVSSLSFDLADILAIEKDPLQFISEWKASREKFAAITLGRDTSAYWNSIMYDDAIVNAAVTKLGNESPIVDFTNDDSDPTDGIYDDVDYLTASEFQSEKRYPANYVCRMLNGIGFAATDKGQGKAFKWDGGPDFMSTPLVSIQFKGSGIVGTRVWFTEHLVLMIDSLIGVNRFRAFLRIPSGCADDEAISNWVIPGITELVEYMSNGRSLSFSVPQSAYTDFGTVFRSSMIDIASKCAAGALVGTTISPGIGTLIGALGGTLVGAASLAMDQESLVNASYDVNKFFQNAFTNYITGLNGLPLSSYVLDLAVRLDTDDTYFMGRPLLFAPDGGCSLCDESPSKEALAASVAAMALVGSACYAAGSRRWYHKNYDYKHPWKKKWVFVPGTIAQTAVSALTGATTAALGAAYSATSNLGGAIKGMLDNQEPQTIQIDDEELLNNVKYIKDNMPVVFKGGRPSY